MIPLKNPTWWDEATVRQADRGERLIQTADFIQQHNGRLNDLVNKAVQALRRYDFDGYADGLEEAFGFLQQYKDYCLNHGVAGSWYYEDQIATAMKSPKAPLYSFNGVVRRLLENKKTPNGCS